MENLEYNRYLLKTAFTCMACDGDIDVREIELIKKLQQDDKVFGELDFEHELESMITSLNQNGHKFLTDYVNEVHSTPLSEEQELHLIEVAIKTIMADDKVEYSEIKFFKFIRSKLNIEDDVILNQHPEFEEYLEDDIISDSYLKRLQADFLDTASLNSLGIDNELGALIKEKLTEGE